ncbi:MAG: L-threonylcarbamoyladenylate synthase [Candidatus Eiseniibacteriota bacterium]
MEIVPVERDDPDPETVLLAAETLLRGGVVAFLTDTIYGLSSLLMDPSAVEFVYRIKRRPANLAVVSLIPEPDDVYPLVESVPEIAETLMRKLWPGPLSIIFKASILVPERVRAERGTIALRVPKNPLAHALLEAVGGPIVSSSANLSGRPPATNAVEIVKIFGNQIDLILDCGEAKTTVASTIVDVSGGRVELVRAGAVDVTAFLGRGAAHA